MSNTPESRIRTYTEYLTYPEGERIEIIDGHIYNMAAAPNRIHQKITTEVLFKIRQYTKSNKGECEVYPEQLAYFYFLCQGNKKTVPQSLKAK